MLNFLELSVLRKPALRQYFFVVGNANRETVKKREVRSFINWNILHRIENSPKEFIVQRNITLLDAFLLGYEDLLLQIDNEEQLKRKYENIPSLDEYARKKYSIDNIGTRNFKSLISFNCEDEHDLFYKYLDFLKEYEREYPMQEVISYTVRKNQLKSNFSNKPHELKEWIKGMKKRYPMYYGDYDISYFRAFLDGYFLCKKDYNIPLTTFETKIIKFTKSIICETVNLTGEFVTWDRLYRYDRDWNAWGKISDATAKEILENFWKDLEQSIKEKLE